MARGREVMAANVGTSEGVRKGWASRPRGVPHTEKTSPTGHTASYHSGEANKFISEENSAHTVGQASSATHEAQRASEIAHDSNSASDHHFAAAAHTGAADAQAKAYYAYGKGKLDNPHNQAQAMKAMNNHHFMAGRHSAIAEGLGEKTPRTASDFPAHESAAESQRIMEKFHA